MKKVCFVALAFLVCASFYTRAELVEEDLATAGLSRKEAAWQKVLLLAGARLPAGETAESLLGPLPGSTELARSEALAPQEFVALHAATDAETKAAMERWARAALRELGRGDVMTGHKVDALLGPEPWGVAGSKFFGVPGVPADAYRALIDYTAWSAGLVDPGFAAGPAELASIDRSLQSLLSLSSPSGRLEYRDFDVVYADVRRRWAGADEAGRQELLPGAVWLYYRLRLAARLDGLPALSDELVRESTVEGGALFSAARERAESLPSDLTALTSW